MKELHINNSISTLVDDDVADFIIKNGLRLKIERGGYVYVYGSLHNLVMKKPHGDKRQVDHINHDILDNRRENLRVVSRSDNMKNREIPVKVTTAKYYHFVKQRGRWRVIYPVSNKMFGEYDTEEEAKLAVSRMLAGEVREVTVNHPSEGLPKYIHKVETFGTTYYQVRPRIDGERIYLGSYKTLEEAEKKLNEFNQRRK